MTAQIPTEISTIISEIEQIHHFLPQDIPTIQTLYEATRRGSNPEHATDYLLLMAENTIAQNNKATAAYILNAVQYHLNDTPPPQFSSVKSELEVLAGVGFTAENATGTIGYQGGRVDITEELALAWKLLDKGDLDQPEYSILVSELAMRAQEPHRGPISSLHTLLGRDEVPMEKLLATIVVDSGVPLVGLANFELESETVTLLPMDFISRHGAIPFETLGPDVLVAVLNPYDELLRTEILNRINKHCHFYMTTPEDFDAVLGSLVSTEAE